VYPAGVDHPKLETARRDGWNLLNRCATCDALWGVVPYEPFASFLYLIAWPSGIEEWLAAVTQDELNLFRWYDEQVRQAYPQMNNVEKRAVAVHRQRSHGRTGFDESESADTAFINRFLHQQ